MRIATLLTFLLTLSVFAAPQVLHLEHLDRLAAKSTESFNLTLDGSLLKAAAAFLELDEDAEDVDIKKLISGLKGISVRSFTFKNEGEYTAADVDPIQAQLRDPKWKRVIQTHSKVDGDMDVYLAMVNGGVTGVAIISAEPKELTIVSIDGSISLDSLRKLSGNFGIPKGLGKAEEKKEEKNK